MRKPIIAGNWKMHKTVSESISLAEGIKDGVTEMNWTEIVICPPFTALGAVAKVISDSEISLGAQNVYWESEGAYTGEISPNFLTDLGCDWVIIGHSERRKYFGETDVNVNRKVKAALKPGLKPIVCVGETLEERERGVTETVVETQVRGALTGLDAQDLDKLVIAYEPVWAIGTGKTASPEAANEVHVQIRKLIRAFFDELTASRIRILYGGSVSPENISELIGMPELDGALVGGASLQVPSFVDIVGKTRGQYG